MKCFKYYAKTKKHCNKKACRYWVDCKENQNCTINLADEGNQTLQKIGSIYGITRMRVCQIEKSIITKIKKRVQETLF